MEINQELQIRLEQAAGDLGPNATMGEYIDAMQAQGGEAGKFIIENPGQTLNLVAQSIPYIFGGGIAAQGIKGGSKIVMQSGDVLKAQSGTANGFDCWVSIVDAISA